jgi:hypothetical protein
MIQPEETKKEMFQELLSGIIMIADIMLNEDPGIDDVTPATMKKLEDFIDAWAKNLHTCIKRKNFMGIKRTLKSQDSFIRAYVNKEINKKDSK